MGNKIIKEVHFKEESSKGILVDVIIETNSFWKGKKVTKELAYIDKKFDKDGNYIGIASKSVNASNGGKFYPYFLDHIIISEMISNLALFKYEEYLKYKDDDSNEPVFISDNV